MDELTFFRVNDTLASDGFDALADLDSNRDGVVNTSDTEFGYLLLWRDLNQDGVSQSGELFTLTEAGIAGIQVAKTEHDQVLADRNQIADLGSYLRADGSAGTLGSVADVNLVSDSFHRSFTDILPTTPATENLPDMQGSGAVRDLRQAATLSADLTATLTALQGDTTRAQFQGRLDTLAEQWAATAPKANNTTYGGFIHIDTDMHTFDRPMSTYLLSCAYQRNQPQ